MANSDRVPTRLPGAPQELFSHVTVCLSADGARLQVEEFESGDEVTTLVHRPLKGYLFPVGRPGGFVGPLGGDRQPDVVRQRDHGDRLDGVRRACDDIQQSQASRLLVEQIRVLRRDGSEVEEVTEETLLALLGGRPSVLRLSELILTIIIIVPVAPRRAVIKRLRVVWSGGGGVYRYEGGTCSVDDLVKFTSVEPDPAAIGAVVDLYS